MKGGTQQLIVALSISGERVREGVWPPQSGGSQEGTAQQPPPEQGNRGGRAATVATTSKQGENEILGQRRRWGPQALLREMYKALWWSNKQFMFPAKGPGGGPHAARHNTACRAQAAAPSGLALLGRQLLAPRLLPCQLCRCLGSLLLRLTGAVICIAAAASSPRWRRTFLASLWRQLQLQQLLLLFLRRVCWLLGGCCVCFCCWSCWVAGISITGSC